MPLSAQAAELLDAIETAEMRSLEWGFVDGSLSEDEVADLKPGIEIAAAYEELVEAMAIVETTNASGGVRVRSRFAEMMRLLVGNRQLFPGKPWQSAPRLVSDFRVDRRKRRFPRRDLIPASVLASHAQLLGKTPFRTALWNRLTSRPNMRLAGFQERATVRLASATDDSGTIITAGTGSGKTIAFYIPAMIRIAEAVSSDRWVKAIAVYPRIELLKDQFAEAFRMSRSIDGALAEAGRRPLVLGALFGSTPTTATPDSVQGRGWIKRGSDFICPWMRCPVCAGELLWTGTDLAAGREKLVCAQRGCEGGVAEDHIVLTRRRLQQSPPDILFTTTEILNQRLSDHWMRGLFGVGGSATRKPFLALLDEVHTYEGASGAQAALTLRRWRHLLASPLTWVGLSATLGDAARFFADLTGVDLDRVVEIGPHLDEFVEEGAEYQILLRGDAASRSSLLSTTIQTSMLVPRLLDRPTADNAMGNFGQKAFLFTDDLDVTNRLFDDLRDAEGLTIFGAIDPTRQPLAALRAGGADAAARNLQGQRWQAAEEIGHRLERPLVVGRTTSQDAGVNQSANIIVATSTLEVGFNDPAVGAVIQHKAPRGMASFLQRKGRAGRDRAMRPFMLTVLSDYGRDRAFYQAYEHLFDPILEPQHLPVRNPYILRIQAVFALFDWMGARTAGPAKAWLWDILSAPKPQAAPAQAAVLLACRNLLSKLVEGDPATIDDLASYLSSSLGLDAAQVAPLLWEPPRSLLMEAVPTLLRRMALQWRMAFPTAVASLDFQIDFHPLPDFVPRNLFSDLSLPEVRVDTPAATVNHQQRSDDLPIVQALTQLAPGRVTRRFAFERGGLSHWSPIDPSIPEQRLSISDYATDHEFVGVFRPTMNEEVQDEDFVVFRPWTVRLEKVDPAVALPSSNSRLSWRSDLATNGDALSIPVSPRSAWRPYVDRVEFYLHRFRSSITVRRFAPVANANIRTRTDDRTVVVSFESDDGKPAALGFEIEVDGFRLDLADGAMAAMMEQPLTPPLAANTRMAYLRERFSSDPALPVELNAFQRDWLFEIMMCGLLAEAATSDRPLAAVADDLLHDDRLGATFAETMQTLFGSPATVDLNHLGDEDAERDAPEDTGTARQGASRLQEGLDEQLANPIVRARLRAVAAEIDDPDRAAFAAWFKKLVLDTLGEAMLQACITAAPQQATLDTLVVDIRDGMGGASIWITETTLGGAGVLEAFAERFAAEPRLFFAAVEAALAPTDLETVDGSLRAILDRAHNDPEVATLLALLRATEAHAERAAHWEALTRLLGRQGGVDLSHALAVSLNTRLLRPGSTPPLDDLVRSLLAHWDALEARLGLALDSRTFAFICSRDEQISTQIRDVLGAAMPAGAIAQLTIAATVTNLLWPRESEVRLKALQSYNPYRQRRTTDPGVVRHLFARQSTPVISLASGDWQTQLVEAFQSHGVVRLSSDSASGEALRKTIVSLLAKPVDVGVLQFYPAIEKIERMATLILVTLTLREQL